MKIIEWRHKLITAAVFLQEYATAGHSAWAFLFSWGERFIQMIRCLDAFIHSPDIYRRTATLGGGKLACFLSMIIRRLFWFLQHNDWPSLLAFSLQYRRFLGWILLDRGETNWLFIQYLQELLANLYGNLWTRRTNLDINSFCLQGHG